MYCKYCGRKIEGESRFCKFCGMEQRQSIVTVPDQARSTPITPVRQSPQNNVPPATAPVSVQQKKRSVIAIFVAILVILVGFQLMSLSIVGKTATASLTSVRQDRESYGESKPNPNRYRIQYTFLVGGKSYAGSSSMIFKQGVRGDQKINIRYLPYYPGINSPADETNILGGLFLTGFGVFLLVMGIKGKGRVKFSMWKRV